MTWIKICGITNLQDAQVAVEAGANALGFVFYDKSPRNIDVETVRKIARNLPDHIERTGVFVNEIEGSICDIADRAGLTAVQFHGADEDPHVADLVIKRRPQLKAFAAVPMLRENPERRAIMWNPQSVYAFLADSGGGSGQVFDWSMSKGSIETIRQVGRVAIAGGLNSLNVRQAIEILHPWGVDVSSGVEASPGKKDPKKIEAFIAAVRNADQAQ